MKEFSPIPTDAIRFLPPKDAGATLAVKPQEQQTTPTVFRDSGGRICWNLPENIPEQNEQLGIQNVQAIFLERFPEFNELFPRGEDGKVVESRRDEARNFILDRIGTRERVIDLISRVAIDRRLVPYFEGTQITAIEKSFSPWGILPLPRVSRESGIYIDGGKRPWAGNKYFSEKFGIDKETVRGKLGGVSWIWGRNKANRKTKLFDVDGVTKKLSIYLDLPKTTSDQKNDPKEARVPMHILSLRLNMGPKTLALYLEGVSVVKGRASNRKVVNLYLESEVREKARDILVLPRTDKKTGVYTDASGRRWTPANYFRKVNKISASNFSVYSRGVASLEGISHSGKVLLYDVEGVERSLAKRRKPRGHWTVEQILNEAREFCKSNGKISQDLLAREGRKDLLSAIHNHFPGGMTAVKEKLGIIEVDLEQQILLDILVQYETYLRQGGEPIEIDEFIRRL